MASRKVDESPDDSQDLAAVSELLSRCSRDDITEEPQTDALNPSVKKLGKFRRTALTFFGVRKNICILPSFFGGRSKNPNKWSSKKGITKSKTHDGLTTMCHDDCLRGRCAATEDSECHSQRESTGELHVCCHHECSHPAAEQKSLTLGRQKKGLRGLFSSFKHHRNNRNLGAEQKNEVTTLPSSPHCKTEVPVVRDNTNEYVTECLGSEPDVPDFADVPHDVSTGAECSGIDTIALESRSDEQESPKSEFSSEVVCDVQMEEMSLMAVVSSDYEDPSGGCGEPGHAVQVAPQQAALTTEEAAGSSDRLNMMFGDVASLKSFDSLTGCGDIIADQEDDSITESTVSEERGRNGGKRASCYLTYQGGGEEMASPDDLNEECLREVWSACNQDQTERTEELSSHNMDLLNSNSVQQASGIESSSMADVLTPQSEHQESVPNSDEGYYDSTTPGPEDGQEKDRQQTDRLPRDSYSGDALYELFAPDESLISPHYENNSKIPGSKPCKYLNEPVDVADSTFVPGMDLLKISSELYEVQNFLESGKSPPELAQNVLGRQETGSSKDCKEVIPKPQGNKNNVEGDVFDETLNLLTSNEARSNPKNVDCEKRHSSLSFGSTSDPDFETFCEPKEQHLEENKPVALPYRSMSSKLPDSHNHPDDGQTVCFSQALVDYTKHSQMLGDNRMDELEMNDAFTPNMEALPTIVTFDVVDVDNEGEYDEQIHMDLEEDIASPYQEFEESYLQKDAFAEFDYQMLDLYEQNLISNTWAVASLPRHLGIARVGHSQTVANPLSLDRRSRSLDTEGLESNAPDTYREERATIVSHPQSERDAEKGSSPHFKRNVHASALDAKDCSGIMALSWQTRSEMALSLPMTDEEITEKVQSISQAHVKHKLFSPSPSCDFPDGKLQRLCPNMSDRVSRGLTSQNAELYNRQCNLPLQSDTRVPHGTFAYPGMAEALSNDVRGDDDDEVFCEAATNLQSYSQCNQSVSTAHREGMSRTGAPLSASKDEMAVLAETRVPRDMALACGNVPETTFN